MPVISTLPTLLGLLRLRTSCWGTDGEMPSGFSAVGVPALLSRGPVLDDRLSFMDGNAVGIFDFGEGLRSSVAGAVPNGEPLGFTRGEGVIFSLLPRACPFSGEGAMAAAAGDITRPAGGERFSAPADRGDGPGMIE